MNTTNNTEDTDISTKVSQGWDMYNTAKATHVGNITPAHKGRGLHWKVFHHKSAFGKAACCALVVGMGNLMAIGADLYWLAGDIGHSMLPHHIPVAIVLSAAFLVTVVSFAYLYHSIMIFLDKQESKHKANVISKRQLEDRLVQLEAKILSLEARLSNDIISNRNN